MVNVGLCLKFDGKGLKAPGYTRKEAQSGGGGFTWTFSKQAITLLKEYKAKFPEFLGLLEKSIRSDSSDAICDWETVAPIRAWLEKIGEPELVPVDAEMLDQEQVKFIEGSVDSWHYKHGFGKYQHVFVKNIPREVFPLLFLYFILAIIGLVET